MGLSAIARVGMSVVGFTILVAATPLSGPGVAPTLLSPGVDNSPLSFQTTSTPVVACTKNLVYDYSDATGCNFISYVSVTP